MTSDEFGQDLEHVEVLQKKFDEFQKVSSFSYFSFGRNVDASEFFYFYNTVDRRKRFILFLSYKSLTDFFI